MRFDHILRVLTTSPAGLDSDPTDSDDQPSEGQQGTDRDERDHEHGFEPTLGNAMSDPPSDDDAQELRDADEHGER